MNMREKEINLISLDPLELSIAHGSGFLPVKDIGAITTVIIVHSGDLITYYQSIVKYQANYGIKPL